MDINKSLLKKGLRNGVLVALYIVAVTSILFYSNSIIGEQEPGVLPMVLGLLLFVVSALVTGTLVLWAPAKLLVQGKTQEAGTLLCTTGATLVLALVIAFVVILIFR